MSLMGRRGARHHRRMIVTLKTQGLQMLVQIRAFLAGSTPLSLTAPQREAAL